jgi:hypothetical protein
MSFAVIIPCDGHDSSIQHHPASQGCQPMRLILNLFISGCLLVSLAGSAFLSGCVSWQPPAFDLEGKPMDPFVEKNSTATVLIFISDDCPISNRYVPEFRRLQDQYAGRGISFWLVHADATETAAGIREHARQFGLTMREIRDPEHRLARLSHAEVTPTAAVFTRGSTLVYHGRIDNRAVSLGLERPVPTQKDLVQALDAVLAGRPVPVPVTQAVGCLIP